MAEHGDALKKPCVFIASLGRTGTQFFGRYMGRMIHGCTSAHEPDILWLTRPGDWLDKVREFGLAHMTVGRFSPRYSIGVLNVSRVRGAIDDSTATEYLRGLRAGTMKRLETDIYLESSGYWALLDLLPKAFPNCRVVFIMRDPRHWVRSWMNMAIPYYSWRDVKGWFPNSRLTPFHVEGDEYRGSWPSMSAFERLCWSWAVENAYAVESASKCDAVRILRYEDLFGESSRDKTFRELLEFVTAFPNGFSAGWTYRPELVKVKVDSTGQGAFSDWTEWKGGDVMTLNRHCGPLMERFGYGIEPEWQSRVESAKG